MGAAALFPPPLCLSLFLRSKQAGVGATGGSTSKGGSDEEIRWRYHRGVPDRRQVRELATNNPTCYVRSITFRSEPMCRVRVLLEVRMNAIILLAGKQALSCADFVPLSWVCQCSQVLGTIHPACRYVRPQTTKTTPTPTPTSTPSAP